MSFFTEIPYVGWLLPFLIVLGVVVFVHEYGHYFAGRMVGIRAEVFSIGFGPQLMAWRDKRGMIWRVGALPLGGYVKFAGDMNPASTAADENAVKQMSANERKGAFHTAALWRRAVTVFAGPAANFLFSIFVFACFAMISGLGVNEPVVGSVSDSGAQHSGLEAGDRVISVNGADVESFSALLGALAESEGKAAPAVVERGGRQIETEIFYTRPARADEIVPGGAAAGAGLKAGDVITAVDGEPVANFEALRRAVSSTGGSMITLDVQRGDEGLIISLTPQMTEIAGPDGEMVSTPLIGVRNLAFGGIEPLRERAGPVEAVAFGADRTWMIITGTFSYLGDMITGRADSSQLGGPVQIARISEQAAEQGLEQLAVTIALLSTSIGLINLFPVPVLDGGHLAFYLIEAVRGRPLRAKWMEIGNSVGFSLLMLLMVFATFNDLMR